VTERLAEAIAETPGVRQGPRMRAVFAPGGTPLTAGAQLRQPALAATLSVLAERGAGALYRGPLAEAFGDDLAELGSATTRADLAAFAPVEEPPLRAQLSSFEILTAGPNSAGVLLAQALLALEAAGLEAPLGADAGATAAITSRRAAAVLSGCR
jgi:gamma-glutamyltranspeptidase/glutathione hydrolase